MKQHLQDRRVGLALVLLVVLRCSTLVQQRVWARVLGVGRRMAIATARAATSWRARRAVTAVFLVRKLARAVLEKDDPEPHHGQTPRATFCD